MKPVALKDFGLTPARGFLPATDPLAAMHSNLEWDELATNLPKYFMGSDLRKRIDALPPFDIAALRDEAETRRAMMVISYLGMAYQWVDTKPAEVLPAKLAVPWYEVGRLVGRPPILSYASYALDNWFRLDQKPDRAPGPANQAPGTSTDATIACGNIALLQNFLGGQDEEWFILIHVDIERRAGQALQAIADAQTAALAKDADALDTALTAMRNAQQEMFDVLKRMPERCDPYIYFHRVRPYIFGWRNNPALPNGVIYEGVEAYRGEGQFFRGETGAQSAIVPALDGALGIEHERDELREYLMEMREYIPPEHVRFIEACEKGPSIRKFVAETKRPTTQTLFNACVELLADFRALHLEYAGTYIHAQAQKETSNPSAVGTGGTPFMIYLRKHRDETRAQTIGA